MAPKNRPSRLVNLNKSPTSNKQKSVENARRSPLLSLPPELRTRIWDHVFDVGIIHVMGTKASRTGYRVFVCQHPHMHEEVPPQSSLEEPRTIEHSVVSPSSMQAHKSCIGYSTRKPARQHLHLTLLQTCRLIYHEAVLKPFSVNEFEYTIESFRDRYTRSEFRRMIDRMVPAQAKAIRRLLLVSFEAAFVSPGLLKQLRGLEHLNIELVSLSAIEGICNRFSSHDGVKSLSELPLKSLHIRLKLGPGVLQYISLDTAAIMTWEMELEDKLLNRATDNDKPNE